MSEVKRVAPGSVFRESLAFSRAVEANGFVFVSATGPTDADGELVAKGAYDQAVNVFSQIEVALLELGLRLSDITRIRIYLSDYGKLDEILRAQRLIFEATPPACSVICVAGFHVEGMHCYIEADAVRSGS